MRAGPDTYTEMWRLIVASRISRSIGVAVELRIPELLARHPHTAAQLAADTGTHQPSLGRLLRLLVATGILEEDADGRYSLSPLGKELLPDRLGPFARFMAGAFEWEVLKYLDHSIKTGERAFDQVYGIRNWEYFAGHPAEGAIFDAAMRALTTPVSEAVAAAFDFSRAGLVADVGGGDGTMLVAILTRHPRPRGLLFDRPGVVERARQRIEGAGLGGRVELVGGSFFEAVPSGADVYTMKSIIHDWNDDESIAIMTRCRAAAGVGGAPLLLVERVLSDRITAGDLDAVLSDLNMLISPGGRERAISEYAGLFERAGYRMARAIPIGLGFQILEGIPV